MVLMATPAGRRVKEALVASLILISACGGSGPLNIRAENCSPWSAPDGQNGYQHCIYTAASGSKYDCYKKPGAYFADCDKK